VSDHSHDDDHGRSHDGHHSRRAFLGSAAAIGAATSLPQLGWAAVPQVGDDMAKAAGAWLGRLDARQRNQAQLDWGNRRREDWHYVPRGRPGLTFRDMTPEQVAAAWDLLGSLLSARGIAQVRGQLKIEGILGELSGSLSFRDPGNYALVVFGDPAVTTAPWAWRFEGHHLSLNFTLAGDHVAVDAPSFLGANPAKVPKGPRAGQRVLAAEEDEARSLLESLSEAQRRDAVFDTRTYGDIVTGNAEKAEPPALVGIAASRLSDAQRAQLLKLIETYARTFEPSLAEARMQRVRDGGIEAVRFGWAGATEQGRQHYYRVQGPLFLIEYDASQDGGNHIHTVWRDFNGDFGRDLLREHYQGTKGTAHRHSERSNPAS
jgi:hypothetical protein